MGLFSDTCQALVDPKTGYALKGAELDRARQDPNWPRCGNKVRKGARYCGKCGAGAPGDGGSVRSAASGWATNPIFAGTAKSLSTRAFERRWREACGRRRRGFWRNDLK